MRGRDEETGEFLSPSRSQNRREALEVLALGEKLVSLTEAQLAKLPVPESLLPHIRECKRITAQHRAQAPAGSTWPSRCGARTTRCWKRSATRWTKSGDAARREVAAMHRIETWRERLLDDGDAALAELLDEYPTADRQQLRQLVRNALEERKRNKPPRAFRELYRELRELLQGARLPTMPMSGRRSARRRPGLRRRSEAPTVR